MNSIESRLPVAVGMLCVFFGLFPPTKSEIPSRNSLANDEVDTIIEKTVEAFETAEAEVLKTKPIIPDDTPVGPHPDADKCVCKGTGKIKHGDGHETDCPYHGKKKPDDDVKPDEKTKCKCDTSSTYCNCIPTYGKCSCVKVTVGSKKSSDRTTPFLTRRILNLRCVGNT